jgi:hypothetical protein
MANPTAQIDELQERALDRRRRWSAGKTATSAAGATLPVFRETSHAAKMAAPGVTQ